MKNQAKLGVSWDMMLQREPYRKSDDWEVHLACSMVLLSLDPEQNASHIQYETIQHMHVQVAQG